MGIPIKGGGRRRRSYADYRPPSRRTPPRSDPSRILIYLVLIAAALWVYLNQQTVRAWLILTPAASGQTAPPGASPASETALIGPGPEEIAVQALEAYHAGDLPEAIEKYRQAADLAPNTVDYHFQAARLLLFRSALEYGDQQAATLDEALEAANNAILANPDAAPGYAILGKIKDWQGNPEEALNNINRALEIDPTYALGQSYLAEALVDLQRWDQAQTTIEYALSLEPGNVDIRRDYAYVLESLGDYVTAATQYEAAMQIEPNLPHIKMSLARIYRVNGRYDEALELFFQVETQYPQNPVVAFEIGRTYETFLGNPVTAAESFERAVELDPNFGSAWVRLGAIYYVQGNYPQTVLALEQALALGIESVDIYYQLGLAYAYQGQCGQALRPLEQARSLASGDERIIDLVNEGLEICSQPTPTPNPNATLAATAAP